MVICVHKSKTEKTIETCSNILMRGIGKVLLMQIDSLNSIRVVKLAFVCKQMVVLVAASIT